MLLVVFVAVIIVVMFLKSRALKGVTPMTPESARQHLTSSPMAIIDVRSPEEYRSGHLKGAQLIPLPELSTRLAQLEQLKNKDILVYCRSGGRSAVACQLLVKSGFTKVNNLSGGTMAWSQSGLPLVTGS